MVQLFGPNIETFNYKIDKLYDENMLEISVARHPRMIIKLKVDTPLNKYDMMRLKVFDK